MKMLVGLVGSIRSPRLGGKADIFSQSRYFRQRPAALAASIAAMLLPVVAAPSSRAADWLSNPTNANWNAPGNWNTGNVPDTTGEGAVFGNSTETSPFLTAGISVGSITFNAGAPVYTISTNGQTVFLEGAGVTNNSANTQKFNIAAGFLVLHDVTSAGTNVAYNVSGAGRVLFSGTSSAGGAVLTAGTDGAITFADTATGSSARFVGTGGSLTISSSSGATDIGSIEGSGLIFFSYANGGASSQTLSIGALNTSTTFSGTITEASDFPAVGAINKVGTGTLTLTGANSYSGGSTINGGTLAIDNAGALGTGGVTVNSGSSLLGTATLTLSNPQIDINGGSTVAAATGTTLTLAPAVFNIGSGGAGNVVFGSVGHTGVVALAASFSSSVANNSTIEVAYGTLQDAGGLNALTSAIAGTVDTSATLDVNGFSDALGSLAGGGTVDNTAAGAVTLTLGGDNTSKTFSGVIKSTGGNLTLVKTGTGTQTLTGESTFVGDVNLNGGTLALGNGNALGPGVVSGGGGLSYYYLQLGADTTLLGTANITLGKTVVGATTDASSTIAAATSTTMTLQLQAGGGTTVFGNSANAGVVALTEANGVVSSSQFVVDYGTLRNAGNLSFTTSRITSLTVNANGTLDTNGLETEIKNLLGAGKLTNDGTTAAAYILQSGDFSGVIQDGASQTTLTKSTAATLTLSGASTYTGGTTVEDGVFALAGGGSLKSNGTVTINGGTFEFRDGTSAQSMTIANSAELKFLNTATAAGASVENNASLAHTIFSGAGVGGSVTAANAMIVNSGTGSYTSFGENSSAGGATTTNSGVDAATYFSRNASGGTARLVNNSATGVFDFSQLTTAGTAAGSIEGNGSVRLGSKVLEVGGNGLSTVFSGVIADGGVVGDTGGSLVKAGTGSLTLTGASTYTGDTTVNGGSLIVNGSIASPTTTVYAPGLLGGVGTIGGSLINGGVVAPGNSPGTLTISGAYTQNSAGTLRIEIGGRSAGGHDLLAVSGVAALGGTVELVRRNGFQLILGDHIVFLTASGVRGKFANEKSEFATGTIVTGKVVYSGDDVALNGILNPFIDVPDLIEEQFPEFARLGDLSPNQLAVAKALDAFVKKHGDGKLIEYLNKRLLIDLPGDFEKLAPEELTALFQSVISLANVQSLNLQRRTDDLRSGSNGFSAQGLSINGQTPAYSGRFGISSGVAGPTGDSSKDAKMVYTPAPDNRWGVFLSGTGEWIDVDGDGNARGYDITSGGFTLGVDYKVTPNFAIGLSAGYAGTCADLANDGRVWVNGGKLGLYATYFAGGFYTDVAVSGGYNSYDTKRGSLQGAARGSTDGGELNVLFGTGYDCTVGKLKIGPPPPSITPIWGSTASTNTARSPRSIFPIKAANPFAPPSGSRPATTGELAA